MKLEVGQRWCLKWFDADIYDHKDDTITFDDTKGNPPFMWDFEITRIDGCRVYITYPDSLENKELMIGDPPKGYNVEQFYRYAGTWVCWWGDYRHFKRSDTGRFKIQSKSDSTTVKTCDTLPECKWWFDNLCNIPWNWKIVTPEGKVLDGKDYQQWK